MQACSHTGNWTTRCASARWRVMRSQTHALARMAGMHSSFNSIEEATGKVRADEMRLDSALRSASEETARLRQDRLKELRALAQLKFGLIKSADLVHDLDAAEQQVKDLLDRIARQISEAESRRQEAADALQKAEAIQRERASAYDAAAGALRARENEIAPRVTSDPAWIALKARFDAASNTADEAEKKAAQAEAGRARKKTPYESDSLFMYLWRRKLGTPDYPSGFFVRYFDEKIAALINYREARANYAMLNQIPNRLRAHADRLARSLRTGSPHRGRRWAIAKKGGGGQGGARCKRGGGCGGGQKLGDARPAI
jgi:DNA repair exonuclease SbcCD ATPase subunit